MIVAKFGGTSVQDANAINKVFEIISRKKDKTLIVVSAFATITNHLVRIIEELDNQNFSDVLNLISLIFEKHSNTIRQLGLSKELNAFIEEKRNELLQLTKALDILGEVTPKSIDLILSYGEMLSSTIIYHYFLKQGLAIKYADARELIMTDSNFTEANVYFEETTNRILKNKLFTENQYVITGGFIASDEYGHTTTLGRGGSDYSAAIFAGALKAKKLEIWTDVDGIMTSDPRMIHDARLILRLSYSEASELAYFGAKVLHPKTIYPAVKNKIPVYVLNTFNPEKPGTQIIDIAENKKMIKAIAFRKGITVINIQSNKMLGAYGFLSKVFDIFKEYRASVDLVTTTEVSISLTLDNDENLDAIVNELEEFAEVSIGRNMAIISAIGEGIKNIAGIAARFFGVLSEINISMVSIGASEINISIVLKESDLEQGVKLIHGEFFGNDTDDEVFIKLD